LKVYIAEYSGFCDGTRRALNIVEKAIAASDGRQVTVVGSVVHNPQVNESLTSRGVRIVPGVEKVSAGAAVILRAHGTPLEDLEKLRSKGAEIFDSVCRNVEVIYKKIQEYRERGFRIILAGDGHHAETVGHLSRGGPDVILISSLNDALSMPDYEGPVVLIAQTSFDGSKFGEIGDALKAKMKSIDIENTLCSWMLKAQAAAEALSRRVNAMVVVGGHGSTNTKRLAEKCAAAGAKTFHVETYAELDEADFEGVELVGITAGASTPLDSIESVAGWFCDCFGADVSESRKN
jgi:(E)-4-hydroxy-3-methyl-but-2-enyl pyrophosphate reductase